MINTMTKVNLRRKRHISAYNYSTLGRGVMSEIKSRNLEAGTETKTVEDYHIFFW